MGAPKDWIFRQLGPPTKSLVLSGYSAPFGRARKDAIVTDQIKIRQKTTYYPGTDAGPTRHVFGVAFEPWELKGRFMDSAGGAGYAVSQTAYVRAFVRDQQPLAITWGDILAFQGFIESFAPSRESESNVAWKMTILIDEDFTDQTNATTTNFIQGPKSYIPDLKKVATPLPKKPPILKPSLLDSLDNMVSSFNSAIANLVNIVNSVDSFEKAILGDIKRLRAGIGQVRTAALTLRNTISSIQTNSLLISRSAGSDIQGLSYIAQTDVDLVRTLGRIAEMDRQAEIAERGKAQTSYVVQAGDTWESLSTKFFSTPARAAQLRERNASKYGAQPEAGASITVPFS